MANLYYDGFEQRFVQCNSFQGHKLTHRLMAAQVSQL